MEEKSKLQLIGEIAQANNKNLELIKEINEKEDEIERLQKENKKLKLCLGIVSPSRVLLEGKYWEKEDNEEIERLNNIINRIKSIYSSLCFSAPENNYIFIEQLGEVLQELKGSDKVE